MDESALSVGMWVLVKLREGWCPALILKADVENKLYSTWYPAPDKVYTYHDCKWSYPDSPSTPLQCKKMVHMTETSATYGARVYGDPDTMEAIVVVSPRGHVSIVARMPPQPEMFRILESPLPGVASIDDASDVDVARARAVLAAHEARTKLAELKERKKRLAAEMSDVDDQIRKVSP